MANEKVGEGAVGTAEMDIDTEYQPTDSEFLESADDAEEVSCPE